MTTPRQVGIIGAGLAGSLLAILLARRGWDVDVYERRGDPRLSGYAGGRSINLALAERGLHALRQAEADGPVLAHAVMMRGRMVHPPGDATPRLQRYGRDDSEVIWSVSRGELNTSLIDCAESAGARLHFDHGLAGVDFERKVATYHGDGRVHAQAFTALLGCDGAGSTLRAEMAKLADLGERSEWLGHGYKELEIPPARDGGFRIEPNALHIWPRGRYMCIALPNDERNFTVTLFMALHDEGHGDPNFDAVDSAADAVALFARDFPDALPLIPALAHDYEANPVGTLGTLYLDRWHLGGDAVLLGDAAHAMVPFHGQGMNCAFEDCVALADHMTRSTDLAAAFAAFERERMPDALAIQKMALDNYIEMRDLVDDPEFLLQRELEQALQARHPGRFVPHYTMVTFMRIPYSVALERSEVQRGILVEATRGLDSLEGLDWAAADAMVEARLEPIAAMAAPT
jgi:kynurenine 3-monooxygenase